MCELLPYITANRYSDVFRPFGRPLYQFGHPNSGVKLTLHIDPYFTGTYTHKIWLFILLFFKKNSIV